MTLDSIPVQAVWLAGCGLPVGGLLARLSLRLPAGEPLFAGGARKGGRAVPLRYPLLAAAGAAVGLWAGSSQPSAVAGVLTALLGWQLLLIAVVDGEHFWLPDQLTFPLMATGLIAAAVLDRPTLAGSIAGAAAGFGVLWLLARVYRHVRGREGLGGGDPFLLAAGGAWTGWIGVPSILLWAALGGLSLVGARLLAGGRVSGSDRLPFGVPLALGVWLTWLLGPLGSAG
ncbi:MAG: A24 family peptidase [Brevundimonas sp.]|uniref:prepilin peptidase n=1 Tax=Brevundimonas sp. TaxID=1871086 RepID=UPI00271F503C|nr:A24 family peptidase [Brevundimonas sp.]MDO9589074.1 A24 family peptidase [Brevundimonas sp.]